MRSLCTNCINERWPFNEWDKVTELMREISLGTVRVVIFPKNCDNSKRPGHPQDGPRTLEELPPSARG